MKNKTISKSNTNSNDVFLANKALILDLLSYGVGNAAASRELQQNLLV